MRSPPPAPMITISAFHDREEALIGKALLEATGIPVSLKEEEGRLFLQVRDTDAAQAQAILSGAEPEERPRRAGKPLGQGRSRPWGPVSRFLRGGLFFSAAVLTLLLLLIPLGVHVRVTPFVLVLLFVFGGCGGILAGSIKIRPKARHLPRL